MAAVKIGGTLVGDEYPCFVIAEIGINHNGDVGIAKSLIDLAKVAGCNAVKFQKRTPELCVPLAQRDKMRDTPWGYIPYMEYRQRIEFGESEYREIRAYCRERNILWFASCWDTEAADFMERFDVPCYKIASASLTEDGLLRHIRAKGRPILLSTGMSTLEQIDHAIEVLGKEDLILLHCVSTYPANYDELNLRVIATLRRRYSVPVGYSGHETGLPSSVAAVTVGACMVERHITLDRSMWGSDQAASLAPNGLIRLVRDIRLVEMAMGDGVKRVFEREKPMIARLRRQD
ncbi:MAG: N-acetylneuraminate synthase family protein [Deltaproteobacteria bacterium]|nr:N-acetylneuraminate synthase family protein [Deltaproteobacteria bacterium]